MKKLFFKFGLLLALVPTTALFYSCDKKDDHEGNDDSNPSLITATNVIGNSSQIATVKAEISYWLSDHGYVREELAQAQYQNNGFTLQLPTTVPDKCMVLFSESVVSGINISDKTAKWAIVERIEVYDKNGNSIGEINKANGSINRYSYYKWYFVDKNVTINGEHQINHEKEKSTDKYDLDLKKGWNIVYIDGTSNYDNSTDKHVYTNTTTSKKPSDITFHWYYESYNKD